MHECFLDQHNVWFFFQSHVNIRNWHELTTNKCLCCSETVAIGQKYQNAENRHGGFASKHWSLKQCVGSWHYVQSQTLSYLFKAAYGWKDVKCLIVEVSQTWTSKRFGSINLPNMQETISRILLNGWWVRMLRRIQNVNKLVATESAMRILNIEISTF